MKNLSVSPLFAALLTGLCLSLAALPSPARAAEGDREVTDVEEAYQLAYSSSTTNRRRRGGAAPVRFNLSVGGGINVGNQWIDYLVDSVYKVPEQGLVEDEEIHNFHFIAKPALDIQVGMELLQERLVVGFHIGITGISQRTDATMTAFWGETFQPPQSTLANEQNVYNPPMVLLGIGGAWVFLPDRLFTPIAGMRLGVGITYDGDYHLIDSWKAWYNSYVESGDFTPPDTESSFSFHTRVPFRAGADLGVRWNAHDKFGVELHVPLELFAMHGYVRGILTGLNARFVLRL